jgi:hypothetical protein
MYRAQRLSEYALYDGDPTLFDSELDKYLDVTPEQIRAAVQRFLDVENRVVLDIVPQMGAEDEARAAVDEPWDADSQPASPQPTGEPTQPTAPPPQVPAPDVVEPPADASAQVSGPLGGPLEKPQAAKTN